MNNKIIVTLTSWKKRINTLSQHIQHFLLSQTIRPDEFHLWLSIEEFPNFEKDLPADLINISKLANIKIHWLEKNEYCNKRWYIYPKYYNDYVASIDDDCLYDPKFIENALNILKNENNTIFCPWRQFFAIPTYNNDIHITFKYFQHLKDIRYWWSANSVIPPKTFPLEALDDKVLELRAKYAKKHDEAWLIPFLIKNNINITSSEYIYQFKTIQSTAESALYNENSRIDKNGYTNTDKALYNMLKYTNNLELYKQYFPTYNTSRYEQLNNIYS